MLSRLIAAPLALLALLLLYLAWTVDPQYAYGLIPLLVAGAILYAFAPQIDWWYYQRRPPALAPKLREALARSWPFYQRLSPADRIRFDQRLEMFRRATDWTPKGWPNDELPIDVQAAISAAAVTTTFRRDKFVFEKFEKVIVYLTAFPSPEYDEPHTSEMYEPDGVLLFSAEHVMHAFLKPGQLYNIALHEYAKVFQLTYPGEVYPDFPDETAAWNALHRISSMSRGHVESVIGIAGVPVLPVAIHHYFTFYSSFKQELPEVAEQFDLVFGLRLPAA